MRIVKIIILCICFSTANSNLLAQNINTKWLMGYDCCTPQTSGINIDFNGGNFIAYSVNRAMNFFETNSEICDSVGNLLFYSNGIYVANALNDTMLNGADLNPGIFTTQFSAYGLTLPQGNLIIPMPGNPNRYYLFHETCDDCINLGSTFYLYFSIVDMNLDGGKGGVIQKNSILLNDTLIPGRITATKHANGRDWWIVVHRNFDGIIFKFLVTPFGIQGPFYQNLFTYRDSDFGQAVFSPSGDKFAYYDGYQDLDIWDFDRCSGLFTNQIHIGINDSAESGGVAFSPNGRLLYVSSMNYVYQFDLNAPNVPGSQTTIGVYDGYISTEPTTFFLEALAPDNKIYMVSGNSVHDLHVINFPDSVGLACVFCQHCIQLPALNAATIPNHPNYFLGAIGGTVCDSLQTGIATIRKPVNDYSVFPNPANFDLYVNLGNEEIKSASVFNSLGQIVSISRDLIKNEYLHFNIEGLENGFYYIELLTEKQKIVHTFVKQ